MAKKPDVWAEFTAGLRDERPELVSQMERARAADGERQLQAALERELIPMQLWRIADALERIATALERERRDNA